MISRVYRYVEHPSQMITLLCIWLYKTVTLNSLPYVTCILSKKQNKQKTNCGLWNCLKYEEKTLDIMDIQ